MSARHVFTIPAVVDRVIDGDSLIVHLHVLPGKEWHGEHVRVEGINAPELSQEGGAAARDFARQLLPALSPVTLVTSRPEKYGRLLASVRLTDGTDFSTLMLAAGHAVPYSG